MILVGLLGAALFPGRFVELPMPEAKEIDIEVVAPTPVYGAHDRAVENVLANVLLEGTASFSKRALRESTLDEGLPLSCAIMPDHLRLSIGVAPENLSEGLTMLKSILEEADLSKDAIDAALAELPYKRPGYWALALQPQIDDYQGVSRREVGEMYLRLFRPANLSIAVSGPFATDTARDHWTALYSDWTPGYVPDAIPGVGSERGTMRATQAITTVELAGPEFKGDDPQLAARLMAIYALGVGKDCAVFRAIRQKLRLSYRQEAFLWPTPGGFRPRILFAVAPQEDEDSLPAKAKSALLEDVASWTEACRSRALAMAEAVYLRGLPLNPMVFQTKGPIDESQADRTFMTAYWPLKTGKYWMEKSLLASMGEVKLEDMKSAAEAMVVDSIPRVISGR